MLSCRLRKWVVMTVTFVVLAGFSPSTAWGQKDINFSTVGTITSTLLFGNFVVPDVYSFFAEAGEMLRIETSNSVFDPTLRVVGPDAEIVLFDDDSGAGDNARIVFRAEDTGVYLVIVSSFSGNPGGGSYTLTFARGAAALQSTRAEPSVGRHRLDVENPVELKPER
ncbi:MAG: PPC domain-containing protein [Acidobacteria bacterium]|nr:PPC domain-containing protein [Acidobacteriota bacterium]